MFTSFHEASWIQEDSGAPGRFSMTSDSQKSASLVSNPRATSLLNWSSRFCFWGWVGNWVKRYRSIPNMATRGSSQWLTVPERKLQSSAGKLTKKIWFKRWGLLINLSIFLLTCHELSLNAFSLFNASSQDLGSIVLLNLGHSILGIGLSWELLLHFTRWILEQQD